MDCAEVSTTAKLPQTFNAESFHQSGALQTSQLDVSMKASSETSGTNSETEPTVILLDDDDTPENEKQAKVTMVIDLDQYEKQRDGGKRKREPNNRCINFECESGEEMRGATAFCLNYYRVKIRPTRLQEVCAACYEESLRYYENLVVTLRAGDCLIEQGGPMRDDFVELDSDEETEPAEMIETDAPLAPETQSFLEDALPKALNDVLEAYDVEGQSDRACDYLTSQQKLLDVALDELGTMQQDIQRQVDALRNDLYATFQQRINELPAIEIGHTFQTPPTVSAAPVPPPKPLTPLAPRPPPVSAQQPVPSPTLVLPPPRRDPERRSNRNIHKPASYCEDDNVDSPPSSDALAKAVPPPLPPVKLAIPPAAPSPKAVIESSAPVSTADSSVLLPPKGLVPRPRPSVEQLYFALRQTLFGAWGKVRVVEITGNVDTSPSAAMYRVRFETKMKGSAGIKMVTGKELAYSIPSPVQLEVGTRVIAVFSDEANIRKDNYFAGVIAETLGTYNNYRYLVFFDDGYAQYVRHNKVLVVCECSKHVWDDVHPESRHFIRKYLENFPQRPMVKLQEGQVVKTEWNGKWWIARVVKVDGSLVHMYFDADSRSEWIYRGSTRLGPLFLEMQAAANRQERGTHLAGKSQPPGVRTKNLPYVEYTRSDAAAAAAAASATTDDATIIETGPTLSIASAAAAVAVAATLPTRAVARKSTNRPANESSRGGPVPSSQNTNIVPFLPTAPSVQQPQSKVVYFTPKSVVSPKQWRPHECQGRCNALMTLPLSSLRGYNPLSKPLLCGWHRSAFRYKGKRAVAYRAPCGRTLRSMSELHRYLRSIGSDMSVDMFDFDFWVHCLAEFVLDKTYRSRRDVSSGVEHVPIPCVNYVDNTMPDFCNYSTQREPKEGVSLNLDDEFLCGCDCEDDCADRSKCACWQLTIGEARTLNKRVPDDLIGYTYKRLPEFVTTGIYECNARCKCSKATCLNRVVQHPLQLKLQLFKTANRGWGIRCLNDIPQGTFICIYAGSLLTDRMANEGGMNYGDEYLAELDYIEVVERQKEGYESDVTDAEEDEEEETARPPNRGHLYEERDDDYGKNSTIRCVAESQIRTRLSRRTEQVEQDKKDDNNSNDSSSVTTVTDLSSTKKTITILTTTTMTTDSNKEKEEDTVTISDDDEILREPSRFAPQPDTNMDEEARDPPKFKSVRKMFGEDEVCYIMDAKNTGNIGRFLNHSCCPNVFVQNVFVDTHDLRFPWVAFFAMNYIRAGTELTWNYNYDVGSVPGKCIFCHCGSSECRGRLL